MIVNFLHAGNVFRGNNRRLPAVFIGYNTPNAMLTTERFKPRKARWLQSN
jgi:hypothetical protein